MLFPKRYLDLPPDFWRENPICFSSLKVYLIWFDSLGAKSSSILIETPEVKILVDPGVAAMQPGYPLPDEVKSRLRDTALACIKEAAREADIIFISHYHYDHHTLPREAEEIYKGKKLWIKNPNLWINHSQWKRARLFLEQLLGSKIQKMYTPSPFFHLQDPMESLPLASRIDYGSYRERKKELLEKGRRWLEGLIERWREGPWVNEERLKKEGIYLAEEKLVQVGATKVKFTPPLFHGVEYDRVGWVTALVVERSGAKLVYASDLQGPSIEDYAHWIVSENPHILVLDGPATYLFGYMLNKINLQRAIGNLIYLLKRISPYVFIYDHHLLRDQRYRERTARVYQFAQKKNKKILTAAEWYHYKPLILKLMEKKN